MPQYGARTGDGLWGALRFFPKLLTQYLVGQVFLLPGCATQQFRLDKSEQHLIGHPQSQVGECLGTPTRTHDDGYTTIWTYDVAQSSSGSAEACSLNVIFKQKYVSSVTSTDASGNPLPRGQGCWTVNLGWCSKIEQAPAAAAAKQ